MRRKRSCLRVSGPFWRRVDDEVTRRAQLEAFRILQSIPGFAGVHVFANRPTGKTIAISLWETEAAVRCLRPACSPCPWELGRSGRLSLQRADSSQVGPIAARSTSTREPTIVRIRAGRLGVTPTAQRP